MTIKKILLFAIILLSLVTFKSYSQNAETFLGTWQGNISEVSGKDTVNCAVNIIFTNVERDNYVWLLGEIKYLNSTNADLVIKSSIKALYAYDKGKNIALYDGVSNSCTNHEYKGNFLLTLNSNKTDKKIIGQFNPLKGRDASNSILIFMSLYPLKSDTSDLAIKVNLPVLAPISLKEESKKVQSLQPADIAPDAKKPEVFLKDTSNGKEAIKQAAIAFYRWYETIWPKREQRATAGFINKMLLTQTKKVGAVYKKYCPCQIDWNVVDDYFAWVKSVGAPVSNQFFSVWRTYLMESEKSLRQDKEERLDEDGGKDLWFYESCSFEDGQDSPQGYDAMGFYNNRCLWDIQIHTDGTATANNTFKTKADWGGSIYAFKIKLVKENSVWKIASPFSEGIVNRAFRPSSIASKPQRPSARNVDIEHIAEVSLEEVKSPEMTPKPKNPSARNVNPINADLPKDKNKGTQVENSVLSIGAQLLFKGVKSKLSVKQKNQIFQKLDFHLTNDKKHFYSDESDNDNEQAYFKAKVDAIDINNDGIEEVFVHWGNCYTAGLTCTNVTLLIKKGDTYESNLGFSGLASMINQYSMGYPNLLIIVSGRGWSFPIWRWNGSKYVFYKLIDSQGAEYGKLKFTNLESVKGMY